MKNIYLLVFLILRISIINAQVFDYPDPLDIALYPQQNGIRNTLNISGLWEFKKDSSQIGEEEGWQNGLTESRLIAVPGSWNEQFTDSRDYLGVAWYQKDTYIPSSWQGQKIFIRVGSANYAAKLWVNGQPVGQHSGGHLPFAFDISDYVNWDASNRICIQIENILMPTRVPPGNVTGGLFSSYPKANFDFFPYAGLQRDVWLYSLPVDASIRDITIRTGFEETTGEINVDILGEGNSENAKVVIEGDGKTYMAEMALENQSASVRIQIPDVHLWSTEDPFLYQISVSLLSDGKIQDYYSLETGVRTIAVNDKQVLLNGKPVFLKGFGKHEDFAIFGKGTARPVIVKDFSLMKWTGANSFRTSHYPYDEEYMRMADREGFLVIDEIPAVGLYFHGDTNELAQRQEMCKQYIEELITRDKNHPSVIMWCVANEPFPADLSLSGGLKGREATPKSVELFEELFDQVKRKDPTRLATLVGVMGGPAEWVGLGDVMCINRYYGWYTHPGDMEGALKILNMELDGLHQKYHKPIMITEFGADTYAGMHADDPEMFTEEFQTKFIKEYLDVADSKDYVTGMHVWAFSDFKTGQGIIRFGGMNFKGVFTRDRKPKAAAYYLRSRWAGK